MAKVNFILRSPNAKTDQPIYLVYRFGSDDKLVYPTKYKTNPKYWNPTTQRVKNIIEETRKDVINNDLNNLFAETELFISKETAERRQLTKESLRKFLENRLNPQTETDNSLFTFIQKFIDQSKSRVNKETGQTITYRTQRKYQNCFDLLKEYEIHYKTKLDFSKIDNDFYANFIELQQNKIRIVKKAEIKGLAVNTIGRNIKTLKTFLNEATELGLNTKTSFKSKSFKIISEEAETIYLNDDDLKKLYQLDLSNNKRLDIVRDLFLMGCYTGLRFSDYTTINPENIKDGFMEVTQQKTLSRVVIPLHPVFIEIWHKYGGKPPKAISNQKFNDYIKEVAKQAEIRENIHIATTKGGIRRSVKHEKWELVSSHTARRSFATNLFKSGFPSHSIMQITGHKTESAFLKYIKVTPDEHAKLLMLHWAKQGQLMKVI